MLTTTLDANADVNVGETLLTEKKEDFVDLELENGGLQEFKRGTVHADETTSTLAVSNSGGSFLM